MRLTAGQRRRIRKATAARDHDPSETQSELNITPFLDVVVNLLMFLLLTSASVIGVVQVHAQLPAYGPPRPAPAPLRLSVTITSEGLVVSGAGQRFAPGCESRTSSAMTTLPFGAAGYDFAGLAQCAVTIKREFPQETEVILSADPGIEYEHLVHVMDAIRRHGSRELFPDIIIAGGVR